MPIGQLLGIAPKYIGIAVLPVSGDNKVQYHAHQCSQANTAYCYAADAHFGTTNTCCEYEGCNYKVACVTKIDPVLYQCVYTDRCDCSEKEKHNASKNRLGNGLEKCAHLAKNRE